MPFPFCLFLLITRFLLNRCHDGFVGVSVIIREPNILYQLTVHKVSGKHENMSHMFLAAQHEPQEGRIERSFGKRDTHSNF